MNLCLAAELFLKAAITHAGAKPPRTHKLVELVGLAPVDYIDSVRTAYNASIPDPDFDKLVAQTSEYFVQVRYGHEFPVQALWEFPLSILGRCLYFATAERVGEKSELQHLRP